MAVISFSAKRALPPRAAHGERWASTTTTMQAFVEFQRGGPFYDMVANFMVAMSAIPAVFNPNNPMKFQKGQYIAINGVQVEGKHLFPVEVYEQAQAGHTTMPLFLGHTCMMVASFAYENVKHLNDHSAEFEFFRHVRNASAHKNQFTFTAEEPRRPAGWRTVILDHSMKGNANPLQGQQCFGPLLGPADLIQLLADIEVRIDA